MRMNVPIMFKQSIFKRNVLYLLVWYFKTFMVDARSPTPRKTGLKLVLLSFTANEQTSYIHDHD